MRNFQLASRASPSLRFGSELRTCRLVERGEVLAEPGHLGCGGRFRASNVVKGIQMKERREMHQVSAFGLEGLWVFFARGVGAHTDGRAFRFA